MTVLFLVRKMQAESVHFHLLPTGSISATKWIAHRDFRVYSSTRIYSNLLLRCGMSRAPARSAQEANDEIRSSLSLHFSHFCRPPTDSASHWRTKMAGAAVWVRGGAGAVVAQRA